MEELILATRLIQKNDVRAALTEFLYGVHALLADSQKQTKLRELSSSLKAISLEIKAKHQNSLQKGTIRKALKEQVERITSLAKSIAKDKKFVNGQLAYDIFDGIVISDGFTESKQYDLVVKQDPERTIAWVCSPSDDDEFDPIKAQIEAEQDYDIPCVDLRAGQGNLLPTIRRLLSHDEGAIDSQYDPQVERRIPCVCECPRKEKRNAFWHGNKGP